MSWIIPPKRKNGGRGHGVRMKPGGRTMPRQKPGLSEQVVGTPWEFIEAVEERFGSLTLDLASTEDLSKAEHFISPEEDTFSVPWVKRLRRLGGGNAWLNPEFGDIRPYTERMATQARKLDKGEKLLLLVPASVGSHWFADHVWEKALILFLRPRLKFIGHKTHFPKDLLLAVYGEEPGVALWQWQETRGYARKGRSS